MRHSTTQPVAVSLLAVLCVGSLTAILGAAAPPPDRAALNKSYQDGNYKVAYEGFRKLAIDPASDPKLVGSNLQMAVNSLMSLGRVDEIDEFRESVVAAHPKNWRLLWAAAESYLQVPNYGYLVGGKFHRGQHEGGGQPINSAERDRVRALQLMVQAMPLARQDAERRDVARFYLDWARFLLGGRGYQDAWRLQYPTDLSQLPDYEDGWYRGHSSVGAPVGDDGQPIYHQVPKTFEGATTDGQRWRWCLTQVPEFDRQRLNEVRFQFADFLRQQFGVQTMAYYGDFFGRVDDREKPETGTFALHTLSEDETIARLASGIRRFKLPDEFNFIRIYQRIVDEGQSTYGEQALSALAQVFEDRRQYPKAAEHWRRNIRQYGTAQGKQDRLNQIVGNWGRFEPITTQPAGKGATVEFRYRNGQNVQFEAHEIRIDRLLDDVKAYLKSNPNQLEWQKLNISELGYRLLERDQQKYLGERVADWSLDLKPRENHLDSRATVTTPLQKAGAYLLTANMGRGNTSKIVLWVADMALVRKPLAGRTYYFVADAVTGEPIPKANLELFGFWQEHKDGNRFQVHTHNFSEFTDESGQLIVGPDQQPDKYQWLAIARSPGGRLAYLGFDNIWYGQRDDVEYDQTKVFAITDRPVYRPGQMVKFKFWIRQAKYDQDEVSNFANQTFAVEVNNPKGEKVLAKAFTSDAYGGIEGEVELPTDATLGMYQLNVVGQGGGNFRVEEYKKPEFEVTVDGPQEPIKLGDKVNAKINAKYFFGSPVIQAKVKYKVLRTPIEECWYPAGPWDWLYGRGYWWFSYDRPWYPGWKQWGCRAPLVWWWGRPTPQPELVAEREVPIGADGSVVVEIDTAAAKAFHPDKDHRYEIVAEVVDQSRRTIIGTGEVLVARQPFQVYVWVDRGYYRVEDVIKASFSAHTLAHKPVKGKGKLTLYKISYDAQRKPIERAVRDWDLDTDAQGLATLQIKASAPGQYRLSYKLTDEKENAIEGGYMLTIIGQDANPADFRYSALELVPDKREYAPKESVNLMVNTDRTDGTVLLFVRPSGGVYQTPKMLRLKGKSAIEEIAVTTKDMPNFFVEAVTITNGKLHTEIKEIVVPPEKRVLNVEVVPSAESYKPAQKATVKIKLTDAAGQPFVGSTVVAMYDKALEYISGGSNVPDIKEFFWKWRRSHYPTVSNSLDRYSANLDLPNRLGMQNLGIFGETVVDELDDAKDFNGRDRAEGKQKSRNRFAATAGIAADGAAAAMPLAEAAQAPGAGADAPQQVQPMIRTKFADTAFWAGSLATNENGLAEISLDMPENLTAWKINVWAMGHGTKVGQGAADVVTRKDLLVRMQAPRFLVERDEVVLSANVHNYLRTTKSVEVVLELPGKELVSLGPASTTVQIDSGSEKRIDWRVKVAREGLAVVRMKALTDEESDAMELTVPVHVHGMLKTESYTGVIRPDRDSAKLMIEVPSERRAEESRLEIRYSPTLAGAMVDALPYLVDYPYGCTEQTLNRFLPAVVTQKVLLDMGLDLKAIEEKRTNLNAQELGDDQKRAAQWKRFDRNPVFDEHELRRVVKDGVQRLTDMQLTDGGWGWFSGYGERSSPHTTAWVVHGLLVARQNDVAVVPGVPDRGIAWLKNYQDEQVQRLKNAAVKPEPRKPWKEKSDNLDALVYSVLVDAGVGNDEMRDFLYRDRTDLAVYAKALLGIALARQGGQDEKLQMILENIRQFVVEDAENETAYLKLPQNDFWWYWYGSQTEANASYLKLLAQTEPKGELASRLVKYLINNRKHGNHWDSTRDTGLVIEAMADYLKASGESKPEMTVEVWIDGKRQKEVRITAADLFTFDNKLVLEGDAVTSGGHQIELKKQGEGPLYFNAYLTNFTLEDDIKRAGLEMKVNRKVYKLVRTDKETRVPGSKGQALDEKVEHYERQELDNLATLTSGDLVEVELEIESKNDYEYLIFEDLKAAGFEPVEVQSGYSTRGLGAYMELRDDRVNFFITRLARGTHTIAYRLRAEIPGRFSALPARAAAMYAPELTGNSDEIKLQIAD